MNFLDPLSLFALPDLIALGTVLLLWQGMGLWVEKASSQRPSVSVIMAEYRREWMRQMLMRDPRIFDAQTINTLRQGTTFFASTCVIALGGLLALIGNADRVAGIATDLTAQEAPTVVWEIKLLLVVVFLTNAFLKFAWANRLFGYCSVVMAAVPNDPGDPKAAGTAKQAAELNITAARSFNRGLRSVYFALASIAWLVGPYLLILTALLTGFVIWRREFASRSRAILLER